VEGKKRCGNEVRLDFLLKGGQSGRLSKKGGDGRGPILDRGGNYGGRRRPTSSDRIADKTVRWSRGTHQHRKRGARAMNYSLRRGKEKET